MKEAQLHVHMLLQYCSDNWTVGCSESYIACIACACICKIVAMRILTLCLLYLYTVAALSGTGHMHILERHLVSVIQLLDVSILRPYLRQCRVITEQEHIQLLNMREDSPNTQAEFLICMVKNKGTRGFHRFMAVLQKTSSQHPGHQDIVDLLQSDIGYLQKSHSQFFGSGHSVNICL